MTDLASSCGDSCCKSNESSNKIGNNIESKPEAISNSLEDKNKSHKSPNSIADKNTGDASNVNSTALECCEALKQSSTASKDCEDCHDPDKAPQPPSAGAGDECGPVCIQGVLADHVHVEIGTCIPDATGTCQRSWGVEGGCCSPPPPAGGLNAIEPSLIDGSSPLCCVTCPSDETTAKAKAKEEEDGCVDDCCASTKDDKPDEESDCGDDCCASAKDIKPAVVPSPMAKEKDDCAAGCCSSNDDTKPVVPPKNTEEESDCEDGCCSSSKPAAPAVKVEEKGGCGDGCCSSANDAKPAVVPAVIAEEKDDCAAGCCSSNNDTKPVVPAKNTEEESDCEDGCCSSSKPIVPAVKVEEKGGCGDGCCSSAKDAKPAVVPAVISEEKDDCAAGCCSSSNDAKPVVPAKNITEKSDCAVGCCSSTKEIKPAVASTVLVTGKDDCTKGCCPPTEDVKAGAACVDDCCKQDAPSCEDDCCAESTTSEDTCCKEGKCNDDAPAVNAETKEDCAEKSCCKPSVKPESISGKRHINAKETSGIPSSSAKSCSGLASFAIKHRKCSDKKGCPSTRADVGADDSTLHPQSHHVGYMSSSSPDDMSARVSRAYQRFYMAACCCVAKQEMRHFKRIKFHKAPSKDMKEEKLDGKLDEKPSSSKAHVQTAHHRRHHHHANHHKHDHKHEAVADGSVDKKVTLNLSVRGMDCPSCAAKVIRALYDLPSVTDAKVNSFNGTATILYDPGRVESEQIAKHVRSLTGFACDVLSSSNEKVKTLKLLVDSFPESWSDLELMKRVTVSKVEKSHGGRELLEVTYDCSEIGGRDALNLFSKWGGKHVPIGNSKKEVSAVERDLADLTKRVVGSALCTLPILILAWAPLPPKPIVYGGISLFFTSIIQLVIAKAIYSAALRSLFLQRMLDMDLLVVLSTTIAYIFSLVAYIFQAMSKPFAPEFFETPALLITLILFGRFVTAHARRRANRTLDALCSLQVDSADLVQADGSVVSINRELVQIGDVLRVGMDSTVPTDGVVIQGRSEVDESTVTGESRPIEKQVDSQLTAGTLNLWGVLDMVVHRLPSDSTISDIQRLMTEAQESRIPVQDIADRVASWIAPIVLTISIVTFCIWIAVGTLVRHDSSTDAAITALKYSIAVMVVACPCAIVLCVPMVVVLAMGVSAKKGVIFKSAEAVQSTKDIGAVIFDKTGTLTKGRLEVTESQLLTPDAPGLVLALVTNSNHPVSQAIATYIQDKKGEGVTPQLDGLKNIPGQGIEASYQNLRICGGNPRWVNAEKHATVERLLVDGLTVFVVKLGENVIAAFGLRDTLREDASEIVDFLKANGKEVFIVSGDHSAVVSAVAKELGIPTGNTRASCTPQGKQDYIRNLRLKGVGRIAFVGDGTNDGPALLQADLGISLSSGTDVAVSAADIVIISPTPLSVGIRTTLTVSREASRRIAFNFGWSFLYNLLAISLAAGAFVKIRITPQFAGLGELVSVLPVLVSAWSMWLIA